MQKEYYSELNEITLFNFEQCLSGQYQFMRVSPTKKWSKKDVVAFNELYEKYLQKYHKKDLDAKINTLKSIIQLQCAYIDTLDDYYLTQVQIKQSQLDKAPEDENKPATTTLSTLITLGKWMSFRQDSKVITVDEYYTIIANYERENKKK